jgi:ADP-ribosyl-[dinitrogen reductase] hydrolase
MLVHYDTVGESGIHPISGHWCRDLSIDLDAIRDWGAAAVITLVEDPELASLKVQHLGTAVRSRHMAWHHLPIRDVSTPCSQFEAQWQQRGEALRSLLRHGFKVLVHCKGGLGRAGTIAARLLAELGVEPSEAIGMVRKVRPGAIETQAQRRHVLKATPVSEKQPDTSVEAISDRAVGALLGLAVGDALGTTLEFRRRDTYPLLTDMIGGGPFNLKPGEWTDDTAMALALADSLIARGELDEHDLMRRFLSWYEQGTYSCTGTCFDIGITTRQALMRFKASGDPIAGSSDPNTAGNGSLMRLAPVAIRFHRDRAKLRDAAARQSKTTHAAGEAVDACIVYAEMLADAIEGQPVSAVLQGRQGNWAGAVAKIAARSWRGKLRHQIRASGYVAHSLEASLWSVARSGTFAEAVLLAANLGEDADTTAAIAGQLAGALHGASTIPSGWLSKLLWKDRIVQSALPILGPEATSRPI